MSDKQLTREVVASIKQSKEYSEEIKKALISEINPSEEAKKNNIKKISVIKQEFFIRKQLLEVLKERVATDKAYQPLFEQIEKVTNSNENDDRHGSNGRLSKRASTFFICSRKDSRTP